MSVNANDEKASVSSKEPVEVPTLEFSKDQYGDKYVQSKGVSKIEALRAAAQTSRSGQRMLWLIGVCVWIAAFAYALQSSTRYATSPHLARLAYLHSRIATTTLFGQLLASKTTRPVLLPSPSLLPSSAQSVSRSWPSSLTCGAVPHPTSSASSSTRWAS